MKQPYALSKKLKLAFAAVALAPALATAQYELQILHASDLEGGVDAIERAPNFAAIVDAIEEDYANTVILSAGDNYIPGPFFNAAGDQAVFRDGGVFNDFYNTLFGINAYDGLREGNGRVDISIMNAIGFDASALGNHEFDAGTDAVETIIIPDFRSPAGPSADRWVGAQFPYLSANLDFSSSSLAGVHTSDIIESTEFVSGPDESTNEESGIPKIAPATLIDVNGELIGVVGATTPLLETISSPGEVSVMMPGTNDMAALAAILQPVIDDIEALGVDKIILVSHLQQFALEQELATLLSGVDIIIAGGSDSILANEGDDLLPEDEGSVAEAYPFETADADANPVLIVSTNGEYSYVGRLIVSFDENGVVLPGSIDPLSGPYVTTDEKVAEIYGADIADAFAEGSKGSLVESLTSAVSGVVIAKDGNTFGNTEVFLDGRRSQVRTQETNLGNFTADANLWFAQQVDPSTVVSIKNGGGIRAAIGEVVQNGDDFDFFPPQANPLSGKEEGQISQLDIENSMRFNNGLSLVTLSASDLLAIIEHGVAASAPGATPGQFPQVGGIKFSFDPSLPAGDRVQSLVIIDEDGEVTEIVVSEGEVVGDAERTFRVVTLNFLAGGGDGYPFDLLAEDQVDLYEEGNTPMEVIEAGVADFATAGTEQDALAEYAAAEFDEDAFDMEETPVEEDERIQNLMYRADEVIPSQLVTVEFAEEFTYVSEDSELAIIDIDVTNLGSENAEIALMTSAAGTAMEGVNFEMPASIMVAPGYSELSIEVTILDDDMVGGTFIAFQFDEEMVNVEGEEIHTVLIADNDNEIVEAPLYPGIQMNLLASLETPEEAVAEISAHDPVSQRLFVTNSEDNQLLVFDFSNPTVSNIINTIEIDEFGGGINSVAVANGIVAIAVEGEETGVRGKIVFTDVDGNVLNEVEAGFLPDMVTFNNAGDKVLVANEGEPNDDYDLDPEGSITIIDISGGVEAAVASEATFNAFDDQIDALRAAGVRIFGPGASVSQDLEPEYITVSSDDATAYVALQENNALAIVDIATATVTEIRPLGFKDHSMVANQLDASDRSEGLFMAAWENVVGMYHPDGMTRFTIDGQDYIITANEGDSRDYDEYAEEERVKDLDLDETVFPYGDILQRDELLGRLTVTTANGDTDGDGDFDTIYAFGGRSFTIWNATTGEIVYDSGDLLESIVAQDPVWSEFFNSTDDELELMNRSDNKGPEPEGVITGQIGDKLYAFVILERMGGVVAFDISNPAAPQFIQYLNTRDQEDGEAGDLAPEGILFVEAANSPTGGNILVISNEVSGTISVISLDDQVSPTLPNCDDFAYYLSDVVNGSSTIYGVELTESGTAELTALKSIDYPVHIAFNEVDGLLYTLKSTNGAIRTLDVSVVDGELSPEVMLDIPLTAVTTATFTNDGDLVIGDEITDELYIVDPNDGTTALYADGAIRGGDIEFDEDGNLYLATREGGLLYNVIPVLDNMVIGTVPSLVTGMALTADAKLIVSASGAGVLESRLVDGSVSDSYTLLLDGEAFTTSNGDLASGCASPQENEGDCDAFSTYYVNHGPGVSGTDVYSVMFSGDEALMTFKTNVTFQAHIAFDAMLNTLYLVNANGSFVRAYDPGAGVFLGDLPIAGGISSLYAAVYNQEDGLLYVGDDGANEIYTIDLGTGVATYYANGPVGGGDLILQGDGLYLVTRTGNKLYEVIAGDDPVLVGNIPNKVNGGARANNQTSIITAHFDGTAFVETAIADASTIGSYTAILDGEVFLMKNGDMAAGCADDAPVIDCPAPGQCYATSATYVQGTDINGNPIAPNRTDAMNSIGMPERTDEIVFTSLGFGGSLTFQFEGSVPNLEGDDIEVVETSFNNPGCEYFPEYADVEVSQDGTTWYYIGTVCKGDPFVDISDAEVALDCVTQVRVSNNDELTTALDGFDVDGVVALHNCIDDLISDNDSTEEETDEAIVELDAELTSELTSFPNPTTGSALVTFTSATTGYTTVDVYDMNGRKLKSVISQVVDAGVEYNVDFNGLDLPNGVYLYRLTNENETINSKFMIAR